MNGITILIWVTIAIIAIIAIILVKLHYRGKELENDEGSILEDAESLTKVFSSGKSMLSKIMMIIPIIQLILINPNPKA